MDETDFSEDTTYKEQEDLPYDGDLSQKKTCNSYKFTSEKDTPDVSDEAILTESPLEKAVGHETCQNTALAVIWDKTNESAVNIRRDKEKQCALTSHIPADKGDTAKSNISDILLHHLSKEQFSRGQGIDCETLPEISNADNFDEVAIVKNIISQYVKSYCPKELTPEFTDQPSPQSSAVNSNKPSYSPGTEEENTSDLEKPLPAGESHHQEDSSFLSRKIRCSGDKQKNCLGHPGPKQPTERASSSNGFKYGQAQVLYQLSDFSKIALKVKIPRNSMINKPLTIANQASFSPRLRDKSTIVQDILATMSKSNCVEKQAPEQKTKNIEPSQPIQMESTTHPHQELTEIESEKCPLKLTPTSFKAPSSNSYIFQKISQGKQMCQKLKEQTDQLKTKVQEFSKRIKQDSLCHLQHRSLGAISHQPPHNISEIRECSKEEHEGCCKNCWHLVTQYVTRRKLSKTKLNMTKEHADCLLRPQGSCSSEMTRLPRAGPAEATFRELSKLACSMKQKVETGGHRRTTCGKFPVTIREKGLHQDSTFSSDPRPSFCSHSGAGLQSKCVDCGTKICNSQRVSSEKPRKEFHYRYNTPWQNYLNHNGRGALAQSCFLHENKKSSPSCSKQKWICSQRVNSESFQDASDSTTGEKHCRTVLTHSPDPETPSSHFYRISGIKSSHDGNSTEETESKILNVALDHALRTATVLKKTTDQMIKAIAEDLAKAQRWRSRMKY